MERQLIRVIPCEPTSGGLVPTMGTKIMVGDQELSGVVKIVLTAEVGDIWKADITCHVRMQPMDALAIIHHPKRWWEKVIDWIAGNAPYQP